MKWSERKCELATAYIQWESMPSVYSVLEHYEDASENMLEIIEQLVAEHGGMS